MQYIKSYHKFNESLGFKVEEMPYPGQKFIYDHPKGSEIMKVLEEYLGTKENPLTSRISQTMMIDFYYNPNLSKLKLKNNIPVEVRGVGGTDNSVVFYIWLKEKTTDVYVSYDVQNALGKVLDYKTKINLFGPGSFLSEHEDIENTGKIIGWYVSNVYQEIDNVLFVPDDNFLRGLHGMKFADEDKDKVIDEPKSWVRKFKDFFKK